MLKRCLVWTIALFVAAIAVFTPASAWAKPVQTPYVQVQLVNEVQSIQPGVPLWVGLHFKIKEGWHTYWHNPGDSGTAPTLDWKLPQGFKAGELVYPYPKRLPSGPLMNFGYEDEVTLLTQITPSAQVAGQSVQLQAQADWLVCQVECIPEDAPLTLTLPVSTNPAAANPQWVETFRQTRQALPKASPWETTAAIVGETLELQVKTPQLSANQVQQVEFFPDQDGVITNAAEQKVSFEADGLQLQLQRGSLAQVDRVNGVLVLREQLDQQSISQAFTIQASVGELTPATAQKAVLPIWQVLFLALAGGMILNLMPCVFPVLFLKAFTVVQRSGESPKQVRLGAIAFTAGVLISFAIVAGTLLMLRSFGQQIGWGFQLQSPGFVLLMAYLMFAVGLSLSGVFVFGASLMGMGQKLTHRSGYAGEFFTGVFATVIATPCTAPFMATAIGIALTQPIPIAIAIFEFLGLGLALPYLILSFIPAVQRLLPKPGAWMETFSQLLAFPLYAATAWLVWVLIQQAGTTGFAIAAAGLLLIAFAAWLHQKTRPTSQRGQRLGTVAALVVVGFALTLTQLPTSIAQSTQAQAQTGVPWQPYTPQVLADLRQAGDPVFVNFTAAWCITCQVNEQVAFNQPEAIAAFQSKNVALLKADWTNRNPDITNALESFGRSGVPLYVLYPADNAEPIVLPQVLSSADVQTAVNNL